MDFQNKIKNIIKVNIIMNLCQDKKKIIYQDKNKLKKVLVKVSDNLLLLNNWI